MKVYVIYSSCYNDSTYIAANNAKEAEKVFMKSDVLFKNEWYDKPYKAHYIEKLSYDTDKPCIIEDM